MPHVPPPSEWLQPPYRRTTRNILVALFGVAILISAIVAFRPKPAPTNKPEEQTAEPSNPVKVATTGDKVGFVGDSFSFGTAASVPEKRWTTVLSERFGWKEANVAVPGSGFIARAETHQSYADQIKKVAAANPNVVIISGGWNDVAQGHSTPDILKSVDAALTLADKTLPHAQVIVIAPVGPATTPPLVEELRRLERQVVLKHHATYVDLRMPLEGHRNWISNDGLHPNDAGYKALADLTARALTPLV